MLGMTSGSYDYVGGPGSVTAYVADPLVPSDHDDQGGPGEHCRRLSSVILVLRHQRASPELRKR